MVKKPESELKEEIKRTLGLESIDRLLEYHVSENAANENISPEKILQQILTDLTHPENKEIYHYFFSHGRDEDFASVPNTEQKKIMDLLSVSLTRARDLRANYGSPILKKLRAPPPELDSEQVEGFSEYWRIFFSIINEAHQQGIKRLGKFIEGIASYSVNDLNTIYNGYILNPEKKGELVVEALEDAVKLLSGDKPEKDILLIKGKYGFKWGETAVRWKKQQPYVFELDPNLEQIIALENEGKYSQAALSKIFDFSSFSAYPDPSPKEFKAYLSLAQGLNAEHFTNLSEPLKMIWEEAEKFRQELHTKVFEEFSSPQFSGSYFATGEMELKQVLKTIGSEENTLFSYFHHLLKQFSEDYEQLARSNFVSVNLTTLYFLDKTGIMPLSKFKKLQKELEIEPEDSTKKTAFYTYAKEWCKIFSFGKTPSPRLLEHFSNYHPDPQDYLNYLKALLKLKEQNRNDYETVLSFLEKISTNDFIFNFDDLQAEPYQKSESLPAITIQAFAKAIAEDKSIDFLVLKSQAEVIETIKVLAQYKVKPEEKTHLITSFLTVTKEFYHSLQNSCAENIILDEYKKWLEKGRKTASFGAWVKHFQSNSHSIQEIFLNYNAPATYEEQVEVSRTVARAVCRKDLPFGRINYPDLALEIPFGGGKTILLPAEINLYPSAQKENAKVYTLLTSLYAGMHAYGGFELNPEALNEIAGKRAKGKKLESLSDYFSTFSNYELAESIFIAAEQLRIFSHLAKNFPGLESEINSYFQARKKAQTRAEFNHPFEEMMFRAYVGAMLKENEEEKDERNREENRNNEKENRNDREKSKGKEIRKKIFRETIELIQNKLNSVRETSTLADSIKVLESIYALVENSCRLLNQPLPPKTNASISPRVLEELLKERMKNPGSTSEEFSVLKERGFRYPEYTPEGMTMSTVYEEKIPPRKNPVHQELLKRGEKYVEKMRERLELLLPEDPYTQRGTLYGKLDPRAFQRYKQEVEAGKVPNPRVRCKKIIEKRDVATILALNLNRSANSPCQGLIPRTVMQQLLVYFSEASQQLGDKIGLYGFSGTGRDNVVAYTFKELEEPFSEDVFYRMGFVIGYDYNRSGAIYRHFTHRLSEVKAEKKLFVEVCPKFAPADLKYEGKTALTDCSLALNRMRLEEIIPLCICLSSDETSRQNLLQTFGEGNYLQTTPQALFKNMALAYVHLTGTD